MAKNDFDIDFDFEEEYGFDPKAILGSDFEDEDLDISGFDADSLGIDLPDEQQDKPGYVDFDLESLDLEDIRISGEFDLNEEAEFERKDEEAPVAEEAEEIDDVDEVFEDDFDDLEDDDDVELMDFSRRASFFDTAEQPSVQSAPADEDVYEATAVEEQISQDLQQMQQEAQEEPEENPDEDLDDDLDDDLDAEPEEEEKPRASRRRQPSEKPPVKLTVPPFLTKLVALYIPPKNAFEQQPDPNNPRRRRRKSKLQIFKEAYLPTVLACLTLVMLIYFCAGAIGNAIERKKVNDEAAKESEIAASEEAERQEQEAYYVMEEASILAAGYDYQGAITMLDSFSGRIEDYPEMVALKSDFVNAQGNLVEWNDPNSIPNLSFHVLIHDATRAFSDKQYGGKYNRNFVTTEEFSRILEQLHQNGYVLVDFDSFVSSATSTDGSTQTFFSESIYLPQGKKPVMITETMVNYFTYMTDKDDDGAYGDGFANKLVVDAGGNIKAEYTDANGQVMTGDYDLVPILETFIRQNPDFAYQGARATLAVCGYDGIFGYRINTSVIATQGQEYYANEVAGAERVVTALRNHGYTLACYTFDNANYKELNANQISEDIKNWTNQIVPVIGDVDVLVYAQTSDIGDYTGNKFTVLHNAGFRYFVTNADQAATTINSTFIKQSRLMVTGNSLAWKSTTFSELFDCNAVLNLAARGGQVPN